MPKTAQRFNKRTELEEATRAECRARWRDRWGFDWSDDVADAWFSGPPSERGREACRLARNLAEALQAALTFCESTPPGRALSEVEKALARCLRFIQSGGNNPDDPDFFGHVDRWDMLMIESLTRLGAHVRDKPGRARLVEASQYWRLRQKVERLGRATLILGEDMTAEDMTNLFINMKSGEIAWASILLGNFPEIQATEMRHGVTIAEVIEKEAKAIQIARNRFRADEKVRMARIQKGPPV